MEPKRRRRVALLVETSRSYGRGLLRGIGSYVRMHQRWSVFHQERSLRDGPPPWLADWKGDGIIARLENRQLVRAVRRLNLPTVDLRGRYALPGIPVLDTDERSVAHLAAEHLLERGFRHFAFCGFNGAVYSERRLKYFADYMAERGLDLNVHLIGRSSPEVWKQEVQGLIHQESLANWLRHLPKPAGVFTCNDVCGQQVLNACRDIGIKVPEEVAVVGVDNDVILCELCDPPLTSVVPDTEKIGFEAAALLESMMDGQQPEFRKRLIHPLGLKTRRSTDVLAITDRVVTVAVRFIREHAADGINVQDSAREAGVSRSTLERRFKKVLGRTPKEELTRVRLERVKRLLRETELPLSEVARMTGFQSPEYLHVVFRRTMDQTPGQYRRRYRTPKRNIEPPGMSDYDRY